MTVRCAECHHAAARDEHNVQRDDVLRKLARRGLLNCLRSNARASSYPALEDRECTEFQRASAEVAEKRIEFFRRLP